MDAYKEFFGDFKENSEFMPRLTEKDRKIVFIVPRQLMDHPCAGATKKEMRWLLDQPENMGKIDFVFGAYEAISKKSFESEHMNVIGDSVEFKDFVVSRLFKQNN
jgi:hypothetical protein